jgi:hypothetical protein
MITMMITQLIIAINLSYYYGNKFPRSTGQPKYKNVKVTPEQAKKAQRGSRGIALLFP